MENLILECLRNLARAHLNQMNEQYGFGNVPKKISGPLLGTIKLIDDAIGASQFTSNAKAKYRSNGNPQAREF